MLAPESRVVLLDELRPPAGYRLDAAVATTFTLDLAAALVPPLAFASFAMRSTPDPVAALEAVRTCTERVDVFCQAGQIAIPCQASDLMAFLEPMVHEVREPRPGHLFHPKIWLMRYCADDDVTRFRLLCLTRNLTGDHAWDIDLRLDGIKDNTAREANDPIATLVRTLPQLAVRRRFPPERAERIKQLSADVRCVEWERPADVDEIAFHVYGISGTDPSADFSGYRHLVVSPFMGDVGLARLAPVSSQEVTVVSRPDSLDRLHPDTAGRVRANVISAIAGIGDEDNDGPQTPADRGLLSGLHAKMYVVERSRAAHMFIGSANATEAAFGGNVEILVELVGGASRLGVATFLEPDAPFRALLEEYDAIGGAPGDPEDEAQRALDHLVRSLAAVPATVTIGAADGAYRLHATTEGPMSIPDGYTVGIELLTRPGGTCQATDGTPLAAIFPGVPLPDITPFLALRATGPDGRERGTVIRAELIGDPAGRLDAVLARQVDSPEKFLRFLALLLGLDDPGLLAGVGSTGDGRATRMMAAPVPGVLELAVRALDNDPSAIADVDHLARHLAASEKGRAVLPLGFDDLWPVVMSAHQRLTKDTTR